MAEVKIVLIKQGNELHDQVRRGEKKTIRVLLRNDGVCYADIRFVSWELLLMESRKRLDLLRVWGKERRQLKPEEYRGKTCSGAFRLFQQWRHTNCEGGTNYEHLTFAGVQSLFSRVTLSVSNAALVLGASQEWGLYFTHTWYACFHCVCVCAAVWAPYKKKIKAFGWRDWKEAGGHGRGSMSCLQWRNIGREERWEREIRYRRR